MQNSSSSRSRSALPVSIARVAPLILIVWIESFANAQSNAIGKQPQQADLPLSAGAVGACQCERFRYLEARLDELVASVARLTTNSQWGSEDAGAFPYAISNVSAVLRHNRQLQVS